MRIVKQKASAEAILQILSASPIFGGLSHETQQELLSGATMRDVRQHEALFERGKAADKLALVLEGSFKLVRISSNGIETIVLIANALDPIGALLMTQRNPVYPVTAIALEPSKVVLVPRSTYLEHWLKHPSVVQVVNLRIFERMSCLQQARATSRLSLRSRTALSLLQLAGSSGEARRIRVPLSRQDLAETVDCSTEALIRALSALASEGIIALEAREIEILSPSRLKAAAAGSS